MLLLVFGNISQINPNSVPRHLRIVSIDTTGLAEALSASSGAALSNFTDIYNANTPYFTKTSGDIRHDGLRKTYEWGLWSKFKTRPHQRGYLSCFLRTPLVAVQVTVPQMVPLEKTAHTAKMHRSTLLSSPRKSC